MIIRKFQGEDAYALWLLHHETIRDYCIKDYSLAQVKAWSPSHYDQQAWVKRITDINPFIAIYDGKIAGYADVQSDGYIDHFYCNKQFIGKGVGGALMRHLFNEAKELELNKLYSHVSITAKPFFEHFYFKVVKPQTVNVRGVELNNFVMERVITDLVVKGGA